MTPLHDAMLYLNATRRQRAYPERSRWRFISALGYENAPREDLVVPPFHRIHGPHWMKAARGVIDPVDVIYQGISFVRSEAGVPTMRTTYLSLSEVDVSAMFSIDDAHEYLTTAYTAIEREIARHGHVLLKDNVASVFGSVIKRPA